MGYELKELYNPIEDDKLWLDQAMIKFDKKFYKSVLNIVNAPAGCGKSTFIFKQFLTESYKYVDYLKATKKCYSIDLNKVLYVCDTNMLKSSILQDPDNKGITKILGKGDLAEAIKTNTLKRTLSNDNGAIKVITYSTLGYLLQQPASRCIILDHYEVILMDEMQNLFKYASRFDTEVKRYYGTVIDNLLSLLDNLLVVALSATPDRIYNGIGKIGASTNTIFKEEIREYKNGTPIKCNSIMNKIKEMGINKKYFDDTKYKAFIYTNTIKKSKKFKEQLEKYGFKAEWLCSINNEKINDDGESIPTMNEYQLSIRSGLLKDGNLPEDLDVIIVNSGYETGWNLRDERVQYAYIDNTDDDTHIQARNRIRHNILRLTYTVMVEKDGTVLEYGRFREVLRTNETINDTFLKIDLDSKYIGKKLSSEDKKYLVDIYGIIQLDKIEANWKSFRIDLEYNDYIVDMTLHGTYIYTKKEFEKIVRSRKDVINVDELFISWLDKEWDKKRITCQDIRDAMDIGIKSFNKLVKEEIILAYFKEHRYKIGNIKNIKNCKTNYLMTY